jgi:amino acid adenylation domain-containing protein
MKLLLTMNLPYTRAHGGANRSNRALAEALARRGHAVEAVVPALASPSRRTVAEVLAELEGAGVEVRREVAAAVFTSAGVEVHAVYEPERLRGYLAERVAATSPEWTLVSSEDPSQSLLDAALRAAPGRVVYLAHTPQMLPFGAESMYPSRERTRRIGESAAIVTISRYVAEVIRRSTGFECFTNHPPHYGPGPFEALGRFENPFVLLLNASTIKGLPIFLALAETMPETRFATVPGYATTAQDLRRLETLPNVTLLENRDDLDDLLEQARVLLMPSLWSEGFGMAAVDAMLRGVPILAADYAGLREATLGTGGLVPVRPITGFQERLGENLLPVPVVPEQDVRPWQEALGRLLATSQEYRRRSEQVRQAALDFVAGLDVAPFEDLLAELARRPRTARVAGSPVERVEEVDELTDLSPDQQAFLILRLLAATREGERPRPGEDDQPLRRAPRDEDPPLSFAQQRLWFLHRLDPSSAAYNMSSAVRVRGVLDGAALAQVFDEIVRRHEVLRTRFPESDGEPRQRIEAPAPLPLRRVDLAGLTPASREAELIRLAREEAARPFDLVEGPVVRAVLLALAPEDHAVLFDLHHVVSDGWSVAVLERELASVFAAFGAGRPSPLPELAIQYADFAAWQRRRLDDRRLERELAWWRQRLRPDEPPLPLPFDRPAASPGRGAGHSFTLQGEIVSRVAALARRHDATRFMVLLAAFQTLLHRWTGADHVTVGTPVAGRLRSELEPLIGFFVNTLAIPGDVSGDPPFGELVERVRDSVLGAFAHQEVPYESVVDAVRPRRRGEAGGLFRVMLAHQEEADGGEELRRLGVEIEGLRRGVGRSLFDLVLTVSSHADRLTASLSYDTARFEPATVAAMARQLTALIAAAVAQPELRLSELPLVADDEPSRRLAAWRTTVSPPSAIAGETGEEEASKSRAAARQEALGAKRERLSDSKRALLLRRLRVRDGEPAPQTGIPRRAGSDPARLSFSQQRLWILWQLQPDSPLYNIPSAVRLEGDLQPAPLAGAIAAIVARHEVLRTRFASGKGGEPVQIVEPAAAVLMPLIDCSALPQRRREEIAQRLADEEAARPFDLTRAPQVRATLVVLGPREHVLLLVLHHIAADGWSASIFVRELKALYRAFAGGAPAALPDLPVQYADFSEWQRERISGTTLDRLLDYWRGRLAPPLPVLALPTDRPRPRLQTHPGATESRVLAAGLADRVEELSRRLGQTTFVTLASAFFALLGRYCGQDDVVIGNPSGNRPHADLEDLIGFFVNTLALRADLSGDPSFGELTGRVRETVIEAQSHQELPFDRLVEELQPDRDPSRSPIFQVMFVLQTSPSQAPAPPTDLRITPMRAEGGTAQFDLILIIAQQGSRTVCSFRYNTDLFDAATAARMLAHYETLLAGAVAEPERRLSRLPLASSEERAQLMAWSAPRAAYPRGLSLGELFEAQVDRTPDAEAVVAEQGSSTYRELDSEANRLARHLIGLGVGPGVAVGLCLRRSPDLVVALLAVVKAGGTYVPLDPEYPLERLAFMVEDAGLAVLLTDEDLADRLPMTWALVVALDAERETIFAAGDSRPGIAVAAEEALYLMYTSGSTGRPKGVVVTHGNVARLVLSQSYFTGGAAETFLLLAPVSFDASTFEVWGALLTGARLAVAPDGKLGLADLAETLRRFEVTTLWLTAGLFHQMVDGHLEDLGGLRQLLAGGDVLSPAHVDRVLAALPQTTLINGYGPTETTTFAACHRMEAPRRSSGPVPIGRPLANTRVHVLDRHGNQVPVGVFGELVVGGDGVARGYHRQPSLTAARFVPDPTGGEPGARLYRTGDLARFRADGTIEFAGRGDFQVKVRGFRVELGEVEAVLATHPAVRQAVAEAPQDATGERRLVAYYVPRGDGDPGPAALAAYLRERLPGFMVPSLFVRLGELPLGATGKVDRAALPVADAAAAGPTDRYVAPRTPVEELMAEVWAQVVGVPRVGVFDDFFEIGGHSLAATLVITRLRDSLGVELALRSLFETPTIAALAGELETGLRERAGAAVPPLLPVARDADLPLSFAQQRLWFLHQLEPESPVYNVPAPVRLGGALVGAALEAVFGEVIRRHEVLRTSFATRGGRAVQIVAPAGRWTLPRVDLAGLTPDDAEREARRLARGDARRPFDMANASPLRLRLLRLGEEDHLLLLNLHHIASDGWSVGVLLREVKELYAAFVAGRPSPLPELVVQYADFARWQRDWLQGEVLERQLDYWRESLAGELPHLSLPFQRPAPSDERGRRGSSQGRLLSPELGARVRELSRESGATQFMTLLAVFKLLLFRYSGTADVVVGTPIANRNRAEIEPLIGFFVNTLALRTRFAAEWTFRELLKGVREVAMGAYVHQDLPFEKIVEELHPDRDLRRNPLFQAAFAFHGGSSEELDLPGLTLKTAAAGTGVVHFDLILSLSQVADGGIKASLAYDLACCNDGSALRMLAHFEDVLSQVVEDPDLPLSEVQVLGEEETGGYAPVDFPEAQLSRKDLEDLMLELSGSGLESGA